MNSNYPAESQLGNNDSSTSHPPSHFDTVVKEFLTCDDTQGICVGWSLDPIYETTSKDPTMLSGMLVICSTTRSRNAWRDAGAPSVLFEHFVAHLAAQPFTPPHPFQKQHLQSKAKPILRSALTEAGDQPPDAQFDPTTLEWKELKKLISHTPEYSDLAKRKFWGDLALAGYRDILVKWSAQMLAKPAALFDYIAQHETTSILFPDGELLSQQMFELIQKLRETPVRVMVTADIRTINPLTTYKLLDVLGAHVHEIEFSHRPQPILNQLNRIAEETHPDSRPLKSLSLESPECSIQTFQDRADLVNTLGITLANTPGLTPTPLQDQQHDALELTSIFNIGDVTGKTILIVTPTKAESLRVAQELQNYVDETITVIGQDGLWRNKLYELCIILDPLQEHTWTHDPDPFKSQGMMAIYLIVERSWSVARRNHPLPPRITELLLQAEEKQVVSPTIQQPPTASTKQTFTTLIGYIIKRLETLGTDPLLRHICDILTNYANAINSDESRSQLDTLIEVADQALDLRLPRAQQESNGDQPWYPNAKHARSPGTSRREVILDLQHQLFARPHRATINRHPDRATIYVSHIQREGNDRADHVIIVRTLPTHMPKHDSTGLDPQHDEKEYTMIYRAISAALESCQLLLVGERPILPVPLSQKISKLEEQIQQAINENAPVDYIETLQMILDTTKTAYNK